MRHIFVDFEMNPIDKRYTEPRKVSKQEIIEIGAVMLDDALRQISEFRQYVKPVYGPVQPIIRRMTRIRPSMLAREPGFAQAMTRFLDWCGEDFTLYTWGPNDIKCVRDEAALKMFSDGRLEASYPQWEDFQEAFVKLVGLPHRISLKQAVGSARAGFTGRAHDALWDAQNTADLFRLSKDEEAFPSLAAAILEALAPPSPPEEITEPVSDGNSQQENAEEQQQENAEENTR